ncbi:MAG: response regulator [Candidatus Omnitrophota bacterium]
MKTILIVEDTQDYADALSFILSRKGFNVALAPDGATGVTKAVRLKPDLILMDVMLPDQDGAETVTQIREHQALSGIPIVFLTALTSDNKPGDQTIVVHDRPYPALSKMLGQDEIVKRVEQFLA